MGWTYFEASFYRPTLGPIGQKYITKLSNLRLKADFFPSMMYIKRPLTNLLIQEKNGQWKDIQYFSRLHFKSHGCRNCLLGVTQNLTVKRNLRPHPHVPLRGKYKIHFRRLSLVGQV